eukprot:gene7972-8793_t
MEEWIEKVIKERESQCVKSSSHRHGFPYTSCFCEENIYCLLRELLSIISSTTTRIGDCDDRTAFNDQLGYHLFAVFISSQSKATPIWCQQQGDPVFWDYHVVACVLEEDSGKALVLDFDTSLPFVTPLQEYIARSFPSIPMRSEYEQWVRLVPAEKFLVHFASDRSHMLNSGQSFPVWPYLRGEKATSAMNLMEYIDMSHRREDEEMGRVCRTKDLCSLLTSSHLHSGQTKTS